MRLNTVVKKNKIAYYLFKTKDNESGVKEIEYNNGKYKIEPMMRNRQIPSSYEVTGYRQEEKYAEEEKDSALQNLCGNLLHFINSLQQEQPEVDLEKEIQEHINACLDVKFPTTDIELIKKDVSYTARKFYELGLNARKEE